MHELHIQPRGFRIPVADGETLLAAARRLGYTYPHACRNGVCGLCKARLLAGDVHYGGVGLHGLSAAERAAGYCLPCTALPLSDVSIEVENLLAPGEYPVTTCKAQVAAIEPVSDDTWRVSLRPPVTARIAFAAGQYLLLVMPDGGKRAFSIASAPEARDTVELHIRATPGHDAALAVMDHLHSTSFVEMELPHGRCVLRPGERPIILLAGGTGFAPMKALIESALARGETRPMQLYRGAHSLNHLYLRELAQDWAARAPWLRYTEVISGEEPAWTGRRGLVHEAVLADHPDLAGFDVYVSGRPEMVDVVYAAFTARGLPADRCFSDMLDLKG